MSAEDIKAFRKTIGLSQEDLAKKLGVTQESVSQWESSKKTPSKPVQMLFDKLRKEISAVARHAS